MEHYETGYTGWHEPPKQPMPEPEYTEDQHWARIADLRLKTALSET